MSGDKSAGPGRVARIAAKVLKISGAGFFISAIAVIIAQVAGVFFVRNWVMLIVLLFSVTGLVSAVVRMFSAVFAEIQFRISEVWFTLLAAGTVAGITNAIFVPIVPGHAKDGVSFVIVLTIFAMMGTGSVWGWSTARSLDAADGWPRLKILIAGWLLVPGIFALFFSVAALIICLLKAEYDGVFGGALILVFSTPLYVPGIRLELRRRKAAKQKLQPPPAPPSASVVENVASLPTSSPVVTVENETV